MQQDFWEEVYKDHEAYMAAGGDPENEEEAPFCLARGAMILRLAELEFKEQGDLFALLAGVYRCAKHNFEMPEWLRRGFVARYDLLREFKVKTTDEAFGTYLPKGAKLPAQRQVYEKAVLACLEVQRRHARGESIGPELFESVGEGLLISGSKVSDYYYQLKDQIQIAPDGGIVPKVRK